MKLYCSAIEWDTDGEDPNSLGLPDTAEVEVSDDYQDNEAANALSDLYGFCVVNLTTKEG